MALRNASNTSTAPAFENDDIVEQPTTLSAAEQFKRQAEQSAREQAAAAAEAQKAAGAAVGATNEGAAKAVAVRQANPLSAGLATKTTLDHLRDVITAEMLESISFGAFPRIVVSPGQFSVKGDGKLLGDEVDILVQSWNYVTLVTAGEQNNKEADKLIRTSYDGVTLAGTGGETVADYIRSLKAQGYDKAAPKKYLEIYCNVIRTGKHGPVNDGKLYQVSVPPTSTGPWGVFLLSQKMAQNGGATVSPNVRLKAGSKTGNGNTWGVIDFEAVA